MGREKSSRSPRTDFLTAHVCTGSLVLSSFGYLSFKDWRVGVISIICVQGRWGGVIDEFKTLVRSRSSEVLP